MSTTRHLHILILEDNPVDADVLSDTLTQEGFEFESARVDTETDFINQLSAHPDLILADYSLLQFNALQALQLLQASGVDIPFIIVTGTVSEETAVACIKQGAADYLLKDRLTRLGQAVVKALADKDLREKRRNADKELAASEIRYRRLFEAAQDGILILDVTTGHVLDANPFLLNLLGYTLENLLGKELWQIGLFQDIETSQEYFRELQDKSYIRYDDLPLKARDGQHIDVEFVSNVYLVNDEQVIQCNIRDITKRKQAEDRIRKLNRTLAVLNDVNQAIARIHDLPTLFEKACGIAVERGAFRMAWIGLLEPKTKRVNPVAHAGVAEGYLENLDIILSDDPRGQGPTASALRAGEHVICNNIETDPRMLPWRDDALRLGYRASAALPLTISGEVRGTLNLYADEPDFFDDEEIQLLDKMAGDIAFAMRFFEQEAQRRQAQAALLDSESRYHRVLDSLLEGAEIIGFDWRYLYVNDASAGHGRQPREVLLRSTVIELYPGIENTGMFAVLRTCMEERTAQHFETEFVFPDGTTTWFDLSVQPIPEGIFILSLDITERKRSETALKRYAERMEILHQIDTGIIQGDSIQALVEVTLKHLRQIIPCQQAVATLLDITTNEALIYASDQSNLSAIRVGNRYPMPPGSLEEFGPNAVVVIDDLQLLPESYPHYQDLKKLGMRSTLLALLTFQRRPIGVLALNANTPGFFTTEHQEIAAEIANQLAIAIRQMRLSEELAHHAAELETKVTERTADLTDAKERVEAILNNTRDGILLIHPDLTIQQTNSSFNLLFGCEQDDYFGKSLVVLVHAEDADAVTKIIQTVVAEQQGKSIEIRIRRKDGKVFDAELSIGHVKDDGLVCTIRDITERKKQERQLRYYASLQQNVTDAVIATDLEFRIQSWNLAAESMYGWRAEEVLGKTVSEVLPAQLASEEITEQVARDFLEKGQWTDEFIQHHRDGSAIHILGSTVLFKDENGKPFGIVSVNHNITARKKAESMLRAKMEEDREFQDYLKELHEITIELTQIDQLDNFYKHAVELGRSRLGFDRLALFLYDADDGIARGTFGTNDQGKLVDERHLRFTPDPNDLMLRAFNRAERFYVDENVPLYSDLKPIGIGWNAAAILWNGRQNVGWLVADNLIHQKPLTKPLLDILALYALTVGTMLRRKQTQAALRESEERFRQIAENIDQILFIRSGDDQKMLYISPRYEVMWGQTRESLYENPMSFIDPVHPDDLDYVLQQLRSKRYVEDGFGDFEYRIIPSDQLIQWVRVRTFPIKNEDGAILRRAGIIEDITERKNAEDALRQSFEKEKELSELKSRFVSMASHEFRTPLATILALTETLSAYRQKMADEQIEQRLGKIRDQVSHLKDIMDDVLQLARLQARRADFNPVRANLDSLCRSILDEYQSRPDNTDQLLYTCDDALREVKLDKKLMRQIISNLVSNAIKYSSKDKPITVSLEYTSDSLVLTVRDTGIGIPEADLKHLFEPFHRAANVGTISGTGLGLVITKESVELHGGTITVASQVEVGTTFTVNIPVTTDGGQAHDENPDN